MIMFNTVVPSAINIYRQLSANFMVVTTILFAHTTLLWATCCLKGNTNQRMGVHGPLNISEVGSGAMEE
jgi:hypothetical protein